jgi:hypothetical protein
MPDRRKAPTKVVVFQCPCGTPPELRASSTQWTALDTLTAKRAAAARRDGPSETAATTRSRRSTDTAFAMHAGLLRQPAA